MTTTMDLDPINTYHAIVAELAQYGYDATVEDTGGGVMAVTVPLGDGRNVLIGGLQDGFCLLDVEDEEGSVTEDGEEIPLSRALAVMLVQRINVDDLPHRA